LLVMLVEATFSFVHRYVPSVLVDPIKKEMGISDLQFSLLQGTAFAVLYGAASLVCGLLADRVHRRNLVVESVSSAGCQHDRRPRGESGGEFNPDLAAAAENHHHPAGRVGRVFHGCDYSLR
jgi:hypothetical protein